MRKRWTPQGEATDALTEFRDKRKWQIALRRYVLEKKRCPAYAPFFGLDINTFRDWIELQFEEGIDWDNFSASWQFDHIVPITYFDFGDMDDMRLAWNFVNIRAEITTSRENKGNKVDVLAAKAYFGQLFNSCGYPICEKMLRKIERIERSQLESSGRLERFIVEKNDFIQTIHTFSEYQYEQLNIGMSVKEINEESELMKKMSVNTDVS